VVLSSTDPAQPYGAALDWPASSGRPSRIAGAVVVSRNGLPLVWFDRRSSHLVTFPAATDDSWAEALALLVKDGRQRSIEVRKVNGDPIDRKGVEASALVAAGFVDGYRGFVLRGV
jgi:ATP-dependent Lhr-like helicase